MLILRRKKQRLLIIVGVLLIIISLVATTLTGSFASEKKKKIVKVACGMNDSLYLDKNGDPAGLCLDYLRQLSWSNNWELQYVEGSYSEGVENLREGKVDLMFPVGKNDDLSGDFAFADFIGGYQQIGLFAKEDADIYYEDYSAFNNKKVGISFGSNSLILDNFANDHNFTYQKVALKSVQDKIDALNSGKVDLISFSTLNTVKGGKLVAILDQVPFYFCTRAEDKELLAELNSGMSKAMIDAPGIVSNMFHNVLKGYNKISFTKEEHMKIQKSKTVTFGVYSDRLPLAGINEDGKCVGIYVDTLKEISKLSGLKIKIIPVEDGDKLYNYMDDGTVDFVISTRELRFHSKNADSYIASNGISDYSTVAVSEMNFKLEKNKKTIFALTKTRGYLKSYIEDNFKKGEIRYYKTRKDCLEAVHKGEADATFLNTWEFNYEVKNPRFQNMMEWESYKIDSQFNLGGRKDSDLEILSILEKTIGQISDERMSEIITNNLDMTYSSYNFSDRLYQAKNIIVIVLLIVAGLLIGLIVYTRVKSKYIKELVVANNTKDEFLSRMSHELRTPLNAIDGYAAMTKHSATNSETEPELIIENMESIQNASDYLLGIINDILDVQQMETGKIVLNKTETDLAEYLKEIALIIQPLADEKGISFTYKQVNGRNYRFAIDQIRVKQVLLNLIYNAIKFTPSGGKILLRGEVTSKDENFANIKITVEDNGIGMSKEFQENRLFQRFAQENRDLTSPYEGCGTGLALCKELLSIMNGNIVCESEQGKGSKFDVIFKTEYYKATRTSRKEMDMETYDLQGIRVLMCEDNLTNQNIEKYILEKMNCVVDIADDGQIGVDKFSNSEENYYDVVLMDIRMPNLDGLAATKKIRRLDRRDAASIPIIAVSANAFEEDIEEALAAGMNEHLAKPVNIKILYKTINKYCFDKIERQKQ